MLSRREEERNEKIIRGLLKLPPNRHCINCNSVGPQYVCTTFWTFVCLTCSGIHREFTHRVKSVSLAKFTTQEVESLQKGGNQCARDIYLQGWDWQQMRLPSSSNLGKIRDFIKDVYVDKKYAAGRPSVKPSEVNEGLKIDDKELRRPDSYHSYSQSPPYDYQYEERRYGKQAASLARWPGSDKTLERKGSSFLFSPGRLREQMSEDRFANESYGSRFSDVSAYAAGDPYRHGGQSPSLQDTGHNSPVSHRLRIVNPEYPQSPLSRGSSAVETDFDGFQDPKTTTSTDSLGSLESRENHGSVDSPGVGDATLHRIVHHDETRQPGSPSLPTQVHPSHGPRPSFAAQVGTHPPGQYTPPIDLFAGFDQKSSTAFVENSVATALPKPVASCFAPTVQPQASLNAVVTAVPKPAAPSSAHPVQPQASLPATYQNLRTPPAETNATSSSLLDLFGGFGDQSSSSSLGPVVASSYGGVEQPVNNAAIHKTITSSVHSSGMPPSSHPLSQNLSSGATMLNSATPDLHYNLSSKPTLQPNIVPPQSFYAFSNPSPQPPVALANQLTSTTTPSNDQGWATFDAPKNTTISVDSIAEAPAPALLLPRDVIGRQMNPFSLQTVAINSTIEGSPVQLANQWHSSAHEVGVSPPIESFKPWSMSDGSNRGSLPNNLPWGAGMPEVAMPGSALSSFPHPFAEHHNTKDLTGPEMQTANSQSSSHSGAIAGPSFSEPFQSNPVVAPQAKVSTNPFDFPGELDQNNNMFMDMNDLQAALPTQGVNSDYGDVIGQPWFLQNSGATFHQGLTFISTQESTAQIQKISHQQGPFSPRNPFE